VYNNKHQLIWHYLDICNYEKAVTECHDVLRDNPHDGLVLLYLSSAYRCLCKYESCIETAFDALKYLESEPHRAYVYQELGQERYANEDYAGAAEYHKKAVELQPEDISHLAYYAVSLAYSGQQDEANQLLKRAEEVEPNNESVLLAKIAIKYKYGKDRDTEEETISRYLLVTTQTLEAYYFFSMFHQKYGEYKTAFDYAVKAFLIDPNSIKIKDLLRNFENVGYGGLLAGQHELIDSLIALKNFRKARAVCLDALADHPDDGIILTKLAATYYELGRYDESVETCLKALKHLEPDNQAHICYILGCVRCVKGDFIQAADYHKKAYDMAPTNLNYLTAYLHDLSYFNQTLPDHYKREKYQEVYDYLISEYGIDSHSYGGHVINYLKKFGYTSQAERVRIAEQNQKEEDRRIELELLDRECQEYLEVANQMKENKIEDSPKMRLPMWFSKFYKSMTQKIRRIK